MDFKAADLEVVVVEVVVGGGLEVDDKVVAAVVMMGNRVCSRWPVKRAAPENNRCIAFVCIIPEMLEVADLGQHAG